MKRPVMILFLALILGECFAIAGHEVWFVFTALPFICVEKIITDRLRRSYDIDHFLSFKFIVIIFLFIYTGFSIMSSQISKADIFYNQLKDGDKAVLYGTLVDSMAGDYGFSYYLENVRLVYNEKVYITDKILVYSKENRSCSIGYSVIVEGSIKQFKNARNFGNYDAKNQNKSKGIYVAITETRFEAIKGSRDYVRSKLAELRRKLGENIDRLCDEKNSGIFSLCDSKAAGIYKAVLLGDRSELDEDIKNIYQVNGISHLLAISGLHVSAIGIFIYKLLRKRFKFAVSASFSMIIVVGFMIMTGTGISVVRASGMFVFYLLCQVLGRKYDLLNALSFVGIAMILDTPFIITNSAFQMSFLAVAGVVIIVPLLNNFLGILTLKISSIKDIKKQEEIKKKIKMLLGNLGVKLAYSLIGSLGINMTLLPVIVYNYFEIPAYSIFINIIVIPLMIVVISSGIVAILAVNFSLPIAKLIILPGCFTLKFYQTVGELFSKIPGSMQTLGRPDDNQIIVYYICILFLSLFIKSFLLIQKNKREREGQREKLKIEIRSRSVGIKKISWRTFRILALMLVCILLTASLHYRDSGEMTILFNDVGQGDNIVVLYNGTCIMIDGGSTDVSNVGLRRIDSALKARAVNKVDYLFITHTDADHINGVEEILEDTSIDKIKVSRLILPATETEEVFENVENYSIDKGKHLRVEDLVINCINPDKAISYDDKNDNSVVLDFSFKGLKMLFTGDISEQAERGILDEISENYNLLKVAHHGSKYSSCQEFVEKVNPDFSVISCGKDNSYGHPHQETLDRLESVGTRIFRTDEMGQITVKIEESNIKMETMVGVDTFMSCN